VSVQTLAAFLLAVVSRWTPAGIPHVPLEDLTRDIAEVTVAEGPAWPVSDEDGMGKAHRHTAVLLATLAYWEGARFAAYVDDLSCNGWMALRHAGKPVPPEGKRLLEFGNCGGGKAYSLWQVETHDLQDGDDVHVFGPGNLGDRKFAARAALLIARVSYRQRGNLSGYTGESKDDHPKADVRQAFARRFW